MTAATAGGVLSDRDLGWLRYLHRKATTPDSWEKDDHPHEHWDNVSTPPMLKRVVSKEDFDRWVLDTLKQEQKLRDLKEAQEKATRGADD